jgi:hypothetical protein
LKNTQTIKTDFREDLPEIKRSDCIRWKVLYEIGGMWSDFDILYLRPIIDLSNYNAIFCPWIAPNGIKINPVAFMGCGQGHALFQSAAYLAHQNLIAQTGNYQQYGRILLDSVLIHKKYDYTDLDHNTVYPFRAHEINRIWQTDGFELNDKTIGIHWFAGDRQSAKFIKAITGPEQIEQFKTINLFRHL